MSKDSQQAITHVLQQDSAALGLILEKLKLFSELHAIICLYVDDKLSKHCTVVNYENGHLVTITASAIWATHFRFQIPNLIPKLQQHALLRDVNKITCKIKPKIPTLSEPKRTMMHPIQPQTAKFINDLADSITHAKLRRIMKKIASYTSN